MSKREATDDPTDTITVQFLRENGDKMTSKILLSETRTIFLDTLKLDEHLLKGNLQLLDVQ